METVIEAEDKQSDGRTIIRKLECEGLTLSDIQERLLIEIGRLNRYADELKNYIAILEAERREKYGRKAK